MINKYFTRIYTVFKDGDKHNYTEDNILFLTWEQYVEYNRVPRGEKYSERSKKQISVKAIAQKKDPIYIKNNSEGFKKWKNEYWSNPENIERVSKRTSNLLKELWKDPEYRKWKSEHNRQVRLAQWREDENYRNKMREAAIESWKDPEYRQKVTKAIHERNADPEWRKKHREAVQKSRTPEFCKKQSKIMQEWWDKRKGLDILKKKQTSLI